MSLSVLGLPPVDPALEERLQLGLGAVERGLADSVGTDTDYITSAARHLLQAGGKRFRPLLVLIGAEYGDHTAPEVVRAGLVVELTHVATLYHDDVMDEAELRRGAQSANSRWDNSVAILTGDLLFARASDIVSELGPEAVQIQARTFSRLVQGQIRETVGPQPGQDSLAHYLSVVADKTASLIATSARLGAKMAGADPVVEQTLTAFGDEVGTAFQLSDDIIDVTSGSDDSGKTPGTDLREGVPTLPTLIAKQSHHPTDHRLLELLSGPLSDDAHHAEALRLLRSNPAMAKARAEVQRRADAARATLERLPDIAATHALRALCDHVTTRTS